MKKHEIKSILNTFLISFGCFAIATLVAIVISMLNIETTNEIKVVIALVFIASAYSIIESLFIFVDDFIYKFSAICG